MNDRRAHDIPSRPQGADRAPDGATIFETVKP